MSFCLLFCCVLAQIALGMMVLDLPEQVKVKGHFI